MNGFRGKTIWPIALIARRTSVKHRCRCRVNAGSAPFNCNNLTVPPSSCSDPDKIIEPNGINGLFWYEGKLFLADQNANVNPNGEILEYLHTGAFLEELVPYTSSPVSAPHGIVLSQDRKNLYAADENTPGFVAIFDAVTGAFNGHLDFSGLPGDPGQYFPRGLVFGPDGLLYVSVFNQADLTAGWILRFDPITGNLVGNGVFASTSTCSDLHRPDGLTFGPDRKLYVTSFQADTTDTDKILIFDIFGNLTDKIILDPDVTYGGPRAYAQAILFGPDERLFVPIYNTGEVRSYFKDNDDETWYSHENGAWKFYPFIRSGGSLIQPKFLTFGRTDPSTLQYCGDRDWCGDQNH